MPEQTVAAPATYVQRRRRAGWCKPAGAVSCTRGRTPGRWGNPYAVGDRLPGGELVKDREHAVDLYRLWLRGQPVEQQAILRHLFGKVLMCWCAPGQVCHVQDVILPLVNEGRLP